MSTQDDYDRIAIPLIKRTYPSLMSEEFMEYIKSGKCRQDTLNKFKELGQMARDKGIELRIEESPESPMNDFAKVINDALK